jgi:hypothetical protein
MHLFMAFPMIQSAAMSDVGGGRFLTVAAISACTYVII